MSVLGDILTAIETGLEGIGLSGIANDDIDVLKLPYYPPSTNTGVLVWPEGDRIDNATNARDDVVYTVWIVPFQKSNQESVAAATQERMQLWKQQIRRTFHNKRLTSSGGTVLGWICKFDASAIFPRTAYDAGYDSAPMALKVWSREVRTN